MIRLFAAGFTAGTIALHQQAVLPAAAAPLVVSALAATWAAVVVLRQARSRRAVLLRVQALVLAVAIACGFTHALVCAHQRMAHALDPDLDEQLVQVEGIVRGLPHAIEARAGQGMRLDFEIESIADRAALARPILVSASWYPPQRKGTADAAPPFEPGQRWLLSMRLRRPHGSVNPAGFDYEAWLFERGFVATALLRDEGALIDGRDDHSLAAAIDRARFAIQQRILSQLEGRRWAGVVVALVVGEQHDIGTDDWTLFNKTGVNHLIAISGLHITLLAAIGAALCTLAWRRAARAGWIGEAAPAAPQCAAVAGLIVATVYTALAGFGVPAARTLAMLAVVVIARIGHRDTRPFHVLAVALLVVVAIDPWSVRAAGFWLSFLAVGCLLYTDRPRSRQRPGWRHRLHRVLGAATRAQLAVTIGLVPVTLMAFQQFSLFGPLANAIAIPVVSYIVTPLALTGALTGSSLLLRASQASFDALSVWLEWLAALPHARLDWPPPEPWAVVLAMAGLAWLAAPRGIPCRMAGLACCVPLLLPLRAAPAPGEAIVTVFDVGQGSAVAVETATHRLVHDTGPRYGDGADAGQRVLLPWLRAQGVAALDAVIVSHDDSDHAGGARSLLAEVQVDWLLASAALERSVGSETLREDCEAGMRWDWDGVRFETLAPDASSMQARKANARSCVLKVSSGVHSMLLTADIEAPQERAMLEAVHDLQATVVTMPHHGSATSSSAAWVAAVAPRFAIAQAGWRNPFGHPRPDVVARYREAGAVALDVSQTGALTIRLSRAGATVSCLRATRPRYWLAAAPADCGQGDDEAAQ
ncbi:DNA internalization-related competence protein ComEC/Rec2 [soil metagenome]